MGFPTGYPAKMDWKRTTTGKHSCGPTHFGVLWKHDNEEDDTREKSDIDAIGVLDVCNSPHGGEYRYTLPIGRKRGGIGLLPIRRKGSICTANRRTCGTEGGMDHPFRTGTGHHHRSKHHHRPSEGIDTHHRFHQGGQPLLLPCGRIGILPHGTNLFGDS